MAQYSTNQDRALQSEQLAVYIIGPGVRKAEQETETQKCKTQRLSSVIDQHTHTNT